jgi:hypothetical protein
MMNILQRWRICHYTRCTKEQAQQILDFIFLLPNAGRMKKFILRSDNLRQMNLVDCESVDIHRSSYWPNDLVYITGLHRDPDSTGQVTAFSKYIYDESKFDTTSEDPEKFEYRHRVYSY